jgi:outer membrane protein OmpA-like peptidoglycan-associated protein
MTPRIKLSLLAIALFGASPANVFAQTDRPAAAPASSYVWSRISVFSYREGPKSHLLFRGTPIAGQAEGAAQVEYQGGNAQISATVEKLPEPASLGPYTVYVLWAVTPDGRATNQGVLVGIDGGKGRLDTQYSAPQFALIVTAEPHFAVSVPSTMIALYNVADGVKGDESKIITLADRSDYSKLPALAIDRKTDSAELLQARYSLAIARSAGAERFASAAYAAANEKLAVAETAARGDSRSQRNTAPAFAREAVVAGEDARRASLVAMAAAQAADERDAAAAAATSAANETAAVATTAAAATAAAATAAAAETAATATAAASKAATDATAVATKAAADATAVARDSERERAASAAAAADEAARADLLARLKGALPTRDSSRGLISSVGGVKFTTGSADIAGTGREDVARFSGIVASYPDMRFKVEGHTDNTGSDATNQRLSLSRATAVRDYLIVQGIPASHIDVAGLGSSMPVSDNGTADGRASNRRVEIVLSGGPLAPR